MFLSALLFPVFAQTPAVVPEELTVTVTRVGARSVDTPAAIDTVTLANIRNGQPLINLSESLGRVPGLTLNNRQNYAQDLQVSSRGFGSRATFGIRGLRLMVDELPATFPDGQAQGAVVPLGSLDRIEVLRGPWAVAYGNASGGVIHAFSAPAGRDPGTTLSFFQGENQQRRIGVKAETQWPTDAGSAGVRAELSRFSAEGFRQHSRVRRDHAYLRSDWDVGSAQSLTLIAGYLDQPETQDPLGLTQAQFDADPSQAGTNAQLNNTRKSVRQHQLGGIWRLESGRAHWTVVAHTGNRKVMQFLATPAAAQAAATSSGGVVDLDRDFAGASARLRLDGSNWQWTIGVEAESSDEARRGFNNFNAAGALGVAGNLRRDEMTRVSNVDLFSQASWTLADWRVLAGARVSRLNFRLRDQFVAAGNPDDSGQLGFRAATPTIGVLRPFGAGLALYASVGRGFETPTTVELAYRPDGNSGFNTALAAGRSRHAELGLKWRDGNIWRADLALYRVQTDNEIVPATNAGGRTSFQNGGRTARHGAEFSARWRPELAWQVALAASHIKAEFRDGFRSTTTAGNVTSTRIVDAGNRLPGVPAQQWIAELFWRPDQPGWSAAVEITRRSHIWADDRNTFAIDAATWANARLLHRSQWRGFGVESFLRIDNLADRRYAGSVIVNEANDRFIESAPGRSFSVGVTLRH